MNDKNPDDSSASEPTVTELVRSIRPCDDPHVDDLHVDRSMLMKHISQSEPNLAASTSRTGRWANFHVPARAKAVAISITAAAAAVGGLAYVQNNPSFELSQDGPSATESATPETTPDTEAVSAAPVEIHYGCVLAEPQKVPLEGASEDDAYQYEYLAAIGASSTERNPIEACQASYVAEGFEVPENLAVYVTDRGEIVVIPGVVDISDTPYAEATPISPEELDSISFEDQPAIDLAIKTFREDPSCEDYDEATKRLRSLLDSAGLTDWEILTTTPVDYIDGDTPPDGFTSCAGLSGRGNIADQTVTLSPDIGREDSGDLTNVLNERLDDCLLGSEAEAWVKKQLSEFELDDWDVVVISNDVDAAPMPGVVPETLADRCVEELIATAETKQIQVDVGDTGVNNP